MFSLQPVGWATAQRRPIFERHYKLRFLPQRTQRYAEGNPILPTPSVNLRALCGSKIKRKKERDLPRELDTAMSNYSAVIERFDGAMKRSIARSRPRFARRYFAGLPASALASPSPKNLFLGSESTSTL
jgi:hypothetical protein